MTGFFKRLFSSSKKEEFISSILTTDVARNKDSLVISGEFLSSVSVEATSSNTAIIYHVEEFNNHHVLKAITKRLASRGISFVCEIQSVSFIRQKNNIAGIDAVPATNIIADDAANSANTSTFDSILKRAIVAGSSDLRFHVRPDHDTCAISHKIDNRFIHVESISNELGHMVIAHVFSNLADQSSHEKGKTSFSPFTIDQGCTVMRTINGKRFKIRYKSLPEAFGGYDVTMRIQPQEADDGGVITLENLNFPDSAVKILRRTRLSRAATIACGRVGVGKTTTLYALMQRPRGDRDEYIGTIEDPVEYRQFGATQVNVDKIGHENAMKAVLRVGYDAVLVGEIRNNEMGQMFLEAQSTGQKIWTTTHETTAFGAFSRLTDETIQLKPSSLFKTNIIGTIFAQELVAKLCPHCKVKATPENLNTEEINYYAELSRLNMPLDNVYRRNTKGCTECNKGTKGRIPLIEIVECDEKLLRLMRQGDEDAAIEYWRSQCTTSILEDDVTGKPMIAQGLYRVYLGDLDIEDLVIRSAIPLRAFEPTVAAPALAQVKAVQYAA